MRKRRITRRTAVALTTLMIGALTIGAGSGTAGAATGDRTDTFGFRSDVTGDDVTCTVNGAVTSRQRQEGGWSLTAYVRISSASSPECSDGLAHLTTHFADGSEGNYDGGGSFVQAIAITQAEVQNVTYQIYFNGCTCYTPVYLAPK